MRRLFVASFVFLSCMLPPPVVAAQVDVEALEHGKQLVHHHRYSEGYKHFKRLAHRGCPYSQCIVGVMHHKGIGTKKNDKAAAFWFQKAASQGLADAKRWLGNAYAEGLGVPRDLQKAERYLSEAAASGVSEARLGLAEIYTKTGIPADLAKAKNVLASLTNGGNLGNEAGAQQRLTATSYESSDNAFSSGLRGLTQSWGGYVSVVKTIQQEIAAQQ